MEAAPISAAVVGRARRTDPDADPDGDARAQLLRVVALLGIGLVAAAILLPSGNAPVVVPSDALQPATSQAAGQSSAGATEPEASGEDDVASGAAVKARSADRFATGSSAAAVVGDDLEAADAARGTTPERRASRSRKTTASTKPQRRSARTTSTQRRTRRAAQSSTGAPSAAATPAPVATPNPTPAPPPRRAQGGPKAEFGGL